ncbi:response regulator [Cohnella zeiphila]|uniref:Response regulator transcription factor n=1 Tax=Cohnella zeiphila TaxID=2761120 RepID=A0A7X0SH03_9BACL|nr:response regulator [Cohnella zeiphila]MBB6729807.1 response regulator transcription factor [Cohnella zeiphila]
MYQVLLVDDDRMDLEGLVRLIPWESLGMAVCGTASNAYDALDLAEGRPVDLLVSDIKMPAMTGLELAERLASFHPGARFLFVSAYEDFHYAKQAIAIHASGYVTKPYDNRELVSALERVRADLDKERKRKPMLVADAVREWLEGEREAEAFEGALREYGLALGARAPAVGIAEIDDPWRIHADPEHPYHGRIGEAVRLIVRMCGEAGYPLACPLGDHRVAVILDKPEGAARMEELVTAVGAREPFTITVGIGRPGAGGDVRESYRQASEALSCKLFYGKNRTIETAPARRHEHRTNAADLDGLFEQLFVAAAGYDLPRIEDGVEALFRYAALLNGKIKANHFAMFVLSKMDAHLGTLNVGLLELPEADWQSFDELARLETLDEMRMWFRRRMLEVSELLQERKTKKGRRLIEEVEAFVRGRLADRLTLRDVADRFAFSPNYFGHLFKEETGEKFTDYVTRLRIEKAKELLGDPKLRVFEVAHQVGFKKIAHFSVQFKQVYGLSPGDYRKQS